LRNRSGAEALQDLSSEIASVVSDAKSRTSHIVYAKSPAGDYQRVTQTIANNTEIFDVKVRKPLTERMGVKLSLYHGAWIDHISENGVMGKADVAVAVNDVIVGINGQDISEMRR
jgi:hypothetical protein